MYDSNDSHTIPLPDKIKERYNDPFCYLMILRIIRPDKLIPGIMDYIIEHMGQKFLSPPPFDLADIYKDSSPTTPLIFVLSPGSDPFATLQAYGKKVGKDK